MSLFTAENYHQALLSLLPIGRAWPRDESSIHTEVIRAISKGFLRSDNDAISLLIGAFPETATTLLDEWEKTLGLPDDCSISEMDTIPKRQAAVVAKLVNSGGQSKLYFISVAKALDYDITITEYRQARAGISKCREPINGNDYPFLWTVNAGETTVKWAWCGSSYAGDPLRSWGNKVLECALSKISPSHTIVRFSYEATIKDYDVYPITNELMNILDVAVNIYLSK